MAGWIQNLGGVLWMDGRTYRAGVRGVAVVPTSLCDVGHQGVHTRERAYNTILVFIITRFFSYIVYHEPCCFAIFRRGGDHTSGSNEKALDG